MREGFYMVNLDTIRAVQGFQLLRQGANILLAILLAKSALGLDGIGLYELLTYLGATISFFWVSGALQSMLTVFPQQDHEQQQRFVFTSYLFFVFMAVLTGLLMVVGKEWIREGLAGGAELLYFEWYVLFLAINLPTFLLEHFLQLYQKPISIISFGLLSFGGQLIVVAVPIYLGWGLYWSILGLVGLAIVKHIVLLGFVLNYGQFRFDGAQLRYWLYLALPLAGYALIGGFSQAFGGWLVNWSYEGNEQLFATWRYGARELPLSLALVSGLSTGLLPVIAGNVNVGLEEVRRRSSRLQHFLLPLAILLMASSSWWFPLVFSPEFEESVPIFNLFLLIIISRLVLSRTLMTGLKENGFVFWVSIVELALNIGLSFLFVRTMGLSGIALGTVLAYTFEKVAHGIWLYWKFNIAPGQYIDLGWLSGYSILLLGVYAWTIIYL